MFQEWPLSSCSGDVILSLILRSSAHKFGSHPIRLHGECGIYDLYHQWAIKLFWLYFSGCVQHTWCQHVVKRFVKLVYEKWCGSAKDCHFSCKFQNKLTSCFMVYGLKSLKYWCFSHTHLLFHFRRHLIHQLESYELPHVWFAWFLKC